MRQEDIYHESFTQEQLDDEAHYINELTEYQS